MITNIGVYLVTDGNGAEALEFYKDAFNAEITDKKLFKDAIPNVAKEAENLLLHGQINIGSISLQISDNNPEHDFVKGNNITAVLTTNSVEETTAIYNKLIVDAELIGLELQETFWSPAYANVTDKYGVMWQLNTDLTK